VGKSPSIFDTEKLTWINSQHMLKYSNEELVNITTPYLEKLGLKIEDRDYAAKALASERERGKTLLELADISAFYFKTKVDYNEEAKAKWLNEDGKKILESLKEKLKNLDEFTNSNIEDIFKEITTQTGFKMLKVAQPLRVAMTGTTVSPGIFEVLSILGKKEVMKRIDEALKG